MQVDLHNFANVNMFGSELPEDVVSRIDTIVDECRAAQALDLYNNIYRDLRGKCHNDLAARFAARDVLITTCNTLPHIQILQKAWTLAQRSADEHSTNR